MKKTIILTLIMFITGLLSFEARAEEPSYWDEVKALGIISGQGLACGSKKYDTFEMLARAILVTKATSDSVQERAMKLYSEEKANTYMSKKLGGLYDCEQVNYRFDNQEIFNMTLYSDGTIKAPDGQIFTPRHPYDVTLVYNKNAKSLPDAQKIYDSSKGRKPKDLKIKVRGID